MATNTANSKEVKKHVKNKGKSHKNDTMNLSLPPANHVIENGLNKPLSTSDTNLSKIGNRSSPKKVSLSRVLLQIEWYPCYRNAYFGEFTIRIRDLTIHST